MIANGTDNNNKNCVEIRSNSSEEGELFGGMSFFHSIEEKEEVIIFQHIQITTSANSTSSAVSRELNVRFDYSFSNIDFFSSYLLIDSLPQDSLGDQSELPLTLYKLVFNIGMTVLPWLWMGYATPRILISESITKQLSLTTGMCSILKQYWTEVYRGILAEFFYMNKSSINHVEVLFEDCIQDGEEGRSEETSKRENDRENVKENENNVILVPLGGKLYLVTI
jgi:hypothetical protein